MDFRQLSYFVAVADKGTVTAAAKALHISQPPLSAQIQQLEQELGCKLFNRGARHMQLTDAGCTFYERACSILDLCISAKNEMADLQTGNAGTLRLGAVSSVCETLLVFWLQRFCANHRNIRFELYEANTYQLLEKVRSNQIELAFVRTPFSAPDLDCVSLQSEPLCAFGMSEYFLGAADESVGLEQLSHVPLLFYRRWEQILMDAFQRESLHPHIFCVSDDARTTICMAESHLGVGIVPQSAIPPRLVDMGHAINHPNLHSEICAVCRRDIYISSAAKQLLKSIRE